MGDERQRVSYEDMTDEDWAEADAMNDESGSPVPSSPGGPSEEWDTPFLRAGLQGVVSHGGGLWDGDDCRRAAEAALRGAKESRPVGGPSEEKLRQSFDQYREASGEALHCWDESGEAVREAWRDAIRVAVDGLPSPPGPGVVVALRDLVRAAAPIEEDGGSEDQREAFSEAFQRACFVLGAEAALPHLKEER